MRLRKLLMIFVDCIIKNSFLKCFLEKKNLAAFTFPSCVSLISSFYPSCDQDLTNCRVQNTEYYNCYHLFYNLKWHNLRIAVLLFLFLLLVLPIIITTIIIILFSGRSSYESIAFLIISLQQFLVFLFNLLLQGFTFCQLFFCFTVRIKAVDKLKFYLIFFHLLSS